MKSGKLPLFEEYGGENYQKLEKFIKSNKLIDLIGMWDDFFNKVLKTGVAGSARVLAELTGQKEESFIKDQGWHNDSVSDLLADGWENLEEKEAQSLYDILVAGQRASQQHPGK